MDSKAWRDYFERHGFERLGGGLFSTVWSKPGSNRCVKVGSRDRWPEYIKWATEQGYAGTFAPKVYSFKQYANHYVAVMERLVCDISSFPSKSELYKFWQDARIAVGKERGYVDVGAPLTKFMRALSSSVGCNDPHASNFMVRKDGQLVCVDPVFTETDDRRKWRIKRGVIIDPTPKTELAPPSRSDTVELTEAPF